MTSPVYYAIGDVHGEADRLGQLHTLIFGYHARHHAGRAMVLIHLGDYVDRGPDSCGVIDRILLLEQQYKDSEDVRIVSLMGNHERMMLDAAFDEPNGDHRMFWLGNGGGAALESYVSRGRVSDETYVDPVHVDWMASLPHIWTAEGGRLIFVHAGIEPREYPGDRDDVHLWTRSPRFFRSEEWDNPVLETVRVIHGHTPIDTARPEISADGRRINIDTGAVFGGPLTCLILDGPDAEPLFLYA